MLRPNSLDEGIIPEGFEEQSTQRFRSTDDHWASARPEEAAEDSAQEEELARAREADETASADADDESTFHEKRPGAREGGSSIKLYLREIGQVKLLTPQEEIELAARIKKGDKKAREQMIKSNLRLVVKIARDYEGIGVPLLDLISEGNIGLMKAVERFDPARGGHWR